MKKKKKIIEKILRPYTVAYIIQTDCVLYHHRLLKRFQLERTSENDLVQTCLSLPKPMLPFIKTNLILPCLSINSSFNLIFFVCDKKRLRNTVCELQKVLLLEVSEGLTSSGLLSFLKLPHHLLSPL